MKILIGYDGSATADEALKDLAKAGLPAKAEVRIVVAVAPLLSPEALALNTTVTAWFPAALSEIRKIGKQEASEAVKTGAKAADIIRKYYPGWKLKAVTCYDIAANGILKIAETWKCDLIVMGSQGWSALGNLLIGSTAEKVLSHAHANVRLGRNPGWKKNSAPKVILAYDGSPDADKAVDEFARREWPKGTEAAVIACMDFRENMREILTEMSVSAKGTPKSAKKPNTRWPWMEAKLELLAEKLAKRGIAVESYLLEGDPRRLLQNKAKEMQADCIFMGSRGLSGVQRFFLGSVASHVAAKASCSVEVIRNGKATPANRNRKKTKK